MALWARTNWLRTVGVPGRPSPCLFSTKYFKSRHCRVFTVQDGILHQLFPGQRFLGSGLSEEMWVHSCGVVSVGSQGFPESREQASSTSDCQNTHLLSLTLPFSHPLSVYTQRSPGKAEDDCLGGCTCSRNHCCPSLWCFWLVSPGFRGGSVCVGTKRELASLFQFMTSLVLPIPCLSQGWVRERDITIPKQVWYEK